MMTNNNNSPANSPFITPTAIEAADDKANHNPFTRPFTARDAMGVHLEEHEVSLLFGSSEPWQKPGTTMSICVVATHPTVSIDKANGKWGETQITVGWIDLEPGQSEEDIKSAICARVAHAMQVPLGRWLIQPAWKLVVTTSIGLGGYIDPLHSKLVTMSLFEDLAHICKIAANAEDDYGAGSCGWHAFFAYMGEAMRNKSVYGRELVDYWWTDFQEEYQGHWGSFEDFAAQWFEDIYDSTRLTPSTVLETLMRHFDVKSYAEELEQYFNIFPAPSGKGVYVFTA